MMSTSSLYSRHHYIILWWGSVFTLSIHADMTPLLFYRKFPRYSSIEVPLRPSSHSLQQSIPVLLLTRCSIIIIWWLAVVSPRFGMWRPIVLSLPGELTLMLVDLDAAKAPFFIFQMSNNPHFHFSPVRQYIYI